MKNRTQKPALGWHVNVCFMQSGGNLGQTNLTNGHSVRTLCFYNAYQSQKSTREYQRGIIYHISLVYDLFTWSNYTYPSGLLERVYSNLMYLTYLDKMSYLIIAVFCRYFYSMGPIELNHNDMDESSWNPTARLMKSQHENHFKKIKWIIVIL